MARKTTWFKDHLKEQLKNPEFRKHYEAYDLPIRLGITIALLRRDKRMTQAQLARKMGVTQQMIAQIESTSGSLPTVRTLEKVAQAFGKTLHIAFR